MNQSKIIVSVQRICIVTETFAPEVNGVAHTLSQLCLGLKRRGIALHVIRPAQTPEELKQPSVDTTCIRGLPVPGYPELKFGLPQYAKIKQALREFDPDAIYIATEGPLGLCTLIAAKQLRINAVSGFHTNFHEYTAHYGVRLIKNITAAYLRVFHNHTKTTFVPTKQMQQVLSNQGFKQLCIMSRGIDSRHFNPEKRSNQLRASWGVKTDEPVLLYVGRMAAEKNIGLVAASYRAQLKNNPDLKLVMVGDGPLKAELEQQIPEALFLGVKRGDELAQIYASADIFLFASLSETFGNVVTEAMSSGLAVVGYDDAALAELGVHHHNAVIAPKANAEQFISNLTELLSQPELIAKIRTNAQATCQNRSWQRISDQFYFDVQRACTGQTTGETYGI